MNFRNIDRENRFKVKMVLFLYILIFLSLGLLGDLTISIHEYGENMGLTKVIPIFLNEVFTFKTIPVFTLIAITIAMVIILITIKYGHKIMLMGSEYEDLSTKEHLTEKEQMLVNLVEGLAISSRLRFKPKVVILNENYMNAFATGWSSGNSLVAITKGLMDKLTREEIEAVMAHEIAHIKNEDVKLTLVLGILNNIMVYMIDILYYVFANKNSKNSKGANQILIVLMILKFVLPLLTIILQLYISRKREYMADAGSAEFTGNPEALATALEKISGNYDKHKDEYKKENATRNYAYIYMPNDSILSTHPNIINRIKLLRNEKIK